MIRRRFFSSVVALTLARRLRAAESTPPRALLTCGRERVHLLDLDTRTSDGTPRKLYTWQAAGRTDLPREYHSHFRSTDECKPLDRGRRILLTSSTGGVAVVDRVADRTLFYGRAANAHSAELLPRDRIAVAASRDPREHKGDSLILFDAAQSGRELWRTELPSGHGVVWDEKRQLLFALATSDIRVYRLADWDSSTPSLSRIALVPLPEAGGHDLFPIPDSPHLAVSTDQHCWLFRRDTRAVTPHPQLASHASIKCLSVHPATRQLVFVQADRPNWWSERIQFLDPVASLSLPGEQFYKARWLAGVS